MAGKEFAALLDSGASASLVGDEVLEHLRRNSVRVRKGETAFQLACGSTTSSGAVRLVVRWNQRARRHRFVHLAGLTVPIILGRDFLAATGIIIDMASGGYREGANAPLVRFQERSMAAMAAPVGKETERGQ
ncbi:MAG: retropepsin-like aspartic protease, partial [Anaplasma sp.]|nr:retropepsin-like aspartic protease [Anaplasma sp.]